MPQRQQPALATARENDDLFVSMKVAVIADVAFDVEATRRHPDQSRRWYGVYVGGEEIGRIEYDPAAPRKARWNAHYQTRIPTSGAFGSKRAACQSLAHRAFD